MGMGDPSRVVSTPPPPSTPPGKATWSEEEEAGTTVREGREGDPRRVMVGPGTRGTRLKPYPRWGCEKPNIDGNETTETWMGGGIPRPYVPKTRILVDPRHRSRTTEARSQVLFSFVSNVSRRDPPPFG